MEDDDVELLEVLEVLEVPAVELLVDVAVEAAELLEEMEEALEEEELTVVDVDVEVLAPLVVDADVEVEVVVERWEVEERLEPDIDDELLEMLLGLLTVPEEAPLSAVAGRQRPSAQVSSPPQSALALHTRTQWLPSWTSFSLQVMHALRTVDPLRMVDRTSAR